MSEARKPENGGPPHELKVAVSVRAQRSGWQRCCSQIVLPSML
jgi:hypothetical protein